ncbi:hypothetical protein [Winogradskyella luteola]|uniref:Uncharacterized protein n=1 Tax=Winogradskyella luteola TaxID=2828330 RepID=A0A9X1F8V5_9FLAO|nr:hypothetical protein [Winogradskyella luteola]MBV7269475.1 hypothetical protein [Winogradskyella luteola]
MKHRKLETYLKFGILILGIPILLFTCEKKEEEQTTEGNFKTVEINDALEFLNLNNQGIVNKTITEDSYLVSVSDNAVQEEITNSDELLTIFPATTIYDHHYSRILFLEIDNEIQSVIFSMVSDENSTDEVFSGDVLITDLSGDFLYGYKVLNGILNSEYISSSQIGIGELMTSAKTNPDCPDCPFSACSYCGELDEIVIIVERGRPPVNYVVISDIFDQGNGSGVNSWDAGASGGSSGTVATPSSDPCDKINSLGTDIEFKNKMNDLKNSTGLNYEKGYYIGLEGDNVYTPIDGNASEQYIDINPQSPIAGFLHSHFGMGDSIFSPGDIVGLYELYNYDLIQNTDTFIFSVVTPQDTAYTIVIDNADEFSNFGNTNLSSQESFNTWFSAYTLEYMTLISSGENQITAREIALLKALEDSGLILTKGSSNFDSWEKLNLNRNNGIVNGDCN